MRVADISGMYRTLYMRTRILLTALAFFSWCPSASLRPLWGNETKFRQNTPTEYPQKQQPAGGQQQALVMLQLPFLYPAATTAFHRATSTLLVMWFRSPDSHRTSSLAMHYRPCR